MATLSWLTKLAFPRMEGPVPFISPQEAHETCSNLGPLYHGTTPDAIPLINAEGFKWEEEEAGLGGSSHGYLPNMDYGYEGNRVEGCSPPVHHLGYGIYLTQSKTRSRDLFGNPAWHPYGSMRNVLEFRLLDTARILEVNFRAPNKMMQWWRDHGFECELSKTDRIAATKMLTATLSNECDACLFTGKGFGRGLDGNQICVYNPSFLRRIDKKLAQTGEIGSKVRRKEDGMMGTLLGRRSLEKFKHLHGGETEFFTIRWRRGGTDMNVYPNQVELL